MKLTNENLYLQHNYAKCFLSGEMDFDDRFDEPLSTGDVTQKDAKEDANCESIKRLRNTFEGLVKDLESDSSEKTINHINELLSKEHLNYHLGKHVRIR